MTLFAAHTTVEIGRSLLQIRDQVLRYGGTNFNKTWNNGIVTLEFYYSQRLIRFTMPTDRTNKQSEKTKWRALHLTIKSKLASVEAGILTFEQSFFAHIVHPDTGKTLYEMRREPRRLE